MPERKPEWYTVAVPRVHAGGTEPGEVMSTHSDHESRDRRALESQKLLFETFKHLTTLAAGSVLLIATMLDRTFRQPSYKWLVGVSLTGFLLCVVASVAMMFASASLTQMPTSEKIEENEVRLFIVVFLFVISSFSIAVLMLALFAVLNL